MIGEDAGEGRFKRYGPPKRKKSDLIDRMLSAYRKRKRKEKIQKLLDREDHWRGLQ